MRLSKYSVIISILFVQFHLTKKTSPVDQTLNSHPPCPGACASSQNLFPQQTTMLFSSTLYVASRLPHSPMCTQLCWWVWSIRLGVQCFFEEFQITYMFQLLTTLVLLLWISATVEGLETAKSAFLGLKGWDKPLILLRSNFYETVIQ